MKKIAIITTVWFPLSHADVIATRWVKPFPTDAACGWGDPQSVIASAYIEQRPETDIGVAFCAANQISLHGTVREALTLTLGTGKLAVDAVLLIAEHGDFPRNEFRQKLYPRKRLFDEIAQVFQNVGASVPVFNDKHFSWDFSESQEMMATAAKLGFPLYGGSSLPHCPCDPPIPSPEGEKITEAVALFSGGADDYGYHSLEFVQALIESRQGRETGIRAVRSLKGRAVYDSVMAGEVPNDLLVKALAAHGYPAEPEMIPFIFDRIEEPELFQIEHHDGLRVSHLLIPKFVSNWIVALRLGSGETLACEVAAGKGGAEFFQNFAYLNVQLEKLIQTGCPPTPPERTHLVTGALQAVLQAVHQNGSWVETPHLGFTY